MTKYEAIVERLEKEPFLKDFTYLKSKSTFVQKFDGGKKVIKLEHWSEWGWSSVRPTIGIRFEFMHKWYEHLCVRTLADQRTDKTIGVQGEMIGFKDVYDFKPDWSNFDEEYQALVTMIKYGTEYVFTKFGTPKDLYLNKILPAMKGIIKLPDVSAEWLFRDLALCRVIAPESYEEFKHVALKQADWIMSRNEINMKRYYNRLDEIINYFESLSVDDLMKTINIRAKK